jgi:mannose-6-phosphate isomerase-like protein (cupin superfamily)
VNKLNSVGKFGEIEILIPGCNYETLQDGRGAIFSWVPESSIKEFTLLYFNAGKIRGNHYHPEFVEYFLVIQGSISLTTFDSTSRGNITMLAGAGFCFKTPIGVSHAIQAVTDAVCISLITKPWDSCEFPIIRTQLINPPNN